MKGRERTYLLLLALAIALAVTVEMIKPEPLDWTHSYERDDQRPYGSLILYDLLPGFFPDAEVRAVNLPPYLVAQDTMRTGVAYVFVTSTFAPDPAETDALLEFAARGNALFLAAADLDGPMADTLGLEIRTGLPPTPLPFPDSLKATDRLNFVNPALQAEEDFAYQQGVASGYFQRFDTVRTTVLGTDDRDRVNYVRIEHGAGDLYVSTVPLAFTNYYLLHDDNAGYVYRALSYLSPRGVLWDAYYKPNRAEASTPLRYVLRQPSLRAAYGVLVALVLLFIFFEARRKQRVVPVIEPVTNTTVEFVRTVGHLYFHHGDHANLARKKIIYFLDYVRMRLRLPTSTIDDAFLARVAERSGVPPDDVRALFTTIEQVRNRKRLPEDDLRRLNRLVEGFYQKSKR